MKQFLLILSVAIILVSCSDRSRIADAGNTGSSQNSIFVTDTTGLAEFKAWKTQQAIQNSTADHNATPSVPVKRSTVRRQQPARDISSSEDVATIPVEKKKKGWSKAAKGAAIGGGSGAVIGAVINKRNRVVGGVIGGVVGAGVGYGIGRSMDKKDGRY
jgi:hypothetical protein